MVQPTLSKKEIVLGKSSKYSKSIIISIAIGIVVMSAAGASILFLNQRHASPVVDASQVYAANSGAVVVNYPVSLFEDGRARHFQHNANGVVIKYFILKSADGVIRAAFDACDVCWPAGKGYVQDGDDMVCQNCGRRFSSVKINEVQGGCNPAPLQRSIQTDHLIIRIEDILQGQKYFNFNKKA